MSNDKHPITGKAPDLVLRSFTLRRGESYVSGVNIPGQPSMLSMWDRDKFGKHLIAEERSNGDVWLHRPDGTRVEVSALVISFKYRGPAVLTQSEPVRRAQ